MEGENNQKGGQIQCSRLYRVRHYETGRYLGREKGRLVLTSELGKNTLFYFETIHTQKNSYLNKDSFFYMRHYCTGTHIGQSENPNLNVFQLCRVSYDEQWKAQLIFHAQKVLKQAVQQFSTQILPLNPLLYKPNEVRDRLRFHHFYKELTYTLSRLNKFVSNLLTENISHDYGKISSSNQSILRNNNILHLAILLLIKGFPDPYDFEIIATENIHALEAELLHEKEFIHLVEETWNSAKLSVKTLERMDYFLSAKKVMLCYKLYDLITKVSHHSLIQSFNHQLILHNSDNQQVVLQFLKYLVNQLGKRFFVTQFLTQIISKNIHVMRYLNKYLVSIVE